MTDKLTPGQQLRQAIEDNNPLQIVGAVTANSAILAEKVGHKALYLSGGGVAASSLGIPDDVAGFHIEDQVMQKRCGHRPNKAIVSQQEMVGRVKSALDARTDALAVEEGMQSAIDRAMACAEAGADMIFPEAMNQLEQYAEFTKVVNIPVLANITEFGATPMFTTEELAGVGVKLVLYPLSAFRAMCKKARTATSSRNASNCPADGGSLTRPATCWRYVSCGPIMGGGTAG